VTVMALLQRWKERVRLLKRNTYALYLARHDPRVPWHAKLLIICVVAYLFSPIDLIPDFIPVIGYLDDLLIVSLGISLALKMIPPEVMAEYRAQAERLAQEKRPVNWTAAAFIIAIWLFCAVALGMFLVRVFRH